MRLARDIQAYFWTLRYGLRDYFDVSDRLRSGIAFLCASAVMVVLLIGFFYVWNRMKIVQVGYEISTLENRNKELKNRKRELLLEIASLESPGELEKKAAKQGLRFPAIGRVIHVP